MALVLLAVLYLALAAALAALGGWLRGGRPPRGVVLALTLLPLAFTVAGFLPRLTLAPTPLLLGVPPWAEPDRMERMAAEAAPNPLLLDPLSQFLPWERAARDDLLFNPAQGSGAALLANGQSAVFFPTQAMARALTPFRAVTFAQASRLLLAAWGMYLLATALLAGGAGRRGPPGEAAPEAGVPPLALELAALVAAAVWTGCGFLQVWRLHPHTLVAATAPWVLLALVALVRRPGPRPAVGLAVTGAVAVAGGHPETLLHVLLFGLALAACLPWAEGTPRAEGTLRRAGRVLLWGAAAAGLAALLAAPLLLPFVDNLQVSTEWELRRGGGTVVEVPAWEAAERLRPTFALLALGDPLDGTWSGPENLAELAGGSVGAAALLLALLALGGRRRRLAGVLLVLAAVGLAVSVHTPWVSRPFGEVPLLRESLLKRLSIWASLAGALLAALGVAAWARALRHPARRAAGRLFGLRPRLALVLAALPVAGALVWAAGWPWWAPAPVVAWEWGTLAVALAALLAGPGRDAWEPAGSVPWQRQVRGAVVVAVLLAALVVPRAQLFARWIPPVSAAGFFADTLSTRYVEERLAAEGRAQGEGGNAGWRVAGLRGALIPHSAAFFGFSEVRAYDPMTYAPYARFLAAAGEPLPTGWVQLYDPAHPVLAFLGTRFVFEHPSAGHRPGVEVVFQGHGGMVYENRSALPRAYLPREVWAHASRPEALAAAEEIGDFARRVTVSGLDVGGLPPGGEGRVIANGEGRVVDLRVEPGRVRAVVEAEAPALVATSQPAIPGWRLLVDGEPHPGVQVNGAFHGVVLPGEGRYRVEMVYAPASWRLGLALFALGVAILAAGAGWSWRRRRRRDGERADPTEGGSGGGGVERTEDDGATEVP